MRIVEPLPDRARRALIVGIAAQALAGKTMAAFASDDAVSGPKPPPNLVVINDRLVTSGQPSAEWLRTLKAQGFEAVVYLAPPTVHDAVADEHAIVGAQGLVFVSIPVNFEQPHAADHSLVSAALQALGSRKVLVHCQVNLRASSLVFLHRVIALREDPERAYAQLSRVWKPNATWKRYLEDELRRHGVAFDVY